MLDKLIELEDQFEEESRNYIQEKVYHKMDELYGSDGIKICNIYYSKQDDDAAQEECDDCEKKAQLMIESIKRTSTIIDSLTGEETQVAISKIDNKCKDIIENVVNEFNDSLTNLNISTNDTLTRNIIIRLLIEHFQNKNKEK